MGSVETSVFKFYRQNVFPRIKNVRGATRTALIFRDRMLDKLPKVEEPPTPVNNLEWDYLFILDAARYDAYQQISNEKIGGRISTGSCSEEYIKNNFSQNNWSDTVLVTGNPFFQTAEENENNQDEFRRITGRKRSEVFHEVFPTFDTNWNDEHGTVMPESIIQDFRTAEKLFPEKKKICHFMQPHAPYVTSDFDTPGMVKDGSVDDLNAIQLAERGHISRKKIREAYRDDLEYVYSRVKPLAKKLDGRVVITSDHGELLGENGLYSHAKDSKAEILRKVPCEVVD